MFLARGVGRNSLYQAHGSGAACFGVNRDYLHHQDFTFQKDYCYSRCHYCYRYFARWTVYSGHANPSDRPSNQLVPRRQSIHVDKMERVLAVQNETKSTATRVTKEGKSITYCMHVLQQPARARACGAGAKCEVLEFRPHPYLLTSLNSVSRSSSSGSAANSRASHI